jgi:hypothetical protein
VQSAVAGGQIVLQAGLVQIDANGNLADLFVNNGNGYPQFNLHSANPPGTFNWGHFETSAAANQLINAVGATQITGSAVAVDQTSYHVKWEIFYTGNQAAGTPSFAIGLAGGAAATGFAIAEYKFWTSGGLTTRLNPTPATFTNNQLGPTLVTAEAHMTLEAWVSFTSAGLLQVNAAEGVAGDTFNINACLTRLEKRQ